MGHVKKLTVQNYRSIKEPVDLMFPQTAPLILVGENNSGKSNIVCALNLVLGESWPGNYELEDHEFHNRDKSNIPVEIRVYVEDVVHTTSSGLSNKVSQFLWSYPPNNERPFRIILEDGREYIYVSSETREQCLCIVVGADRRLSYQLSYASKYTFLSRLMRRFHQALTYDAERVTELKNKFEEIKTLFHQVPSFTLFAEELKNQVAELSGNLEYCLEIDFSAYDPSNYFHALHAYPYQGDQVLTFEELGTGQEQILAICFAYAYAKAFHGQAEGLILIIEEPEVHLHPLAQRWVGKKIHELASQGVQVIVTTHSPAFLNLLNLEGVAVFRKEGNATRVTQLSVGDLMGYCKEHGATKATEDSILPFYAAAATEEILAGFLARKVILVEGPTEALALPIYLDRVGLSVAQDGIAVIPVHGVGNLAKWWRLFTAYLIPTYIVFDNDASKDTSGTRRRDILQTVCVSVESIDALIAEGSWIVDNHFTLFGNNFEETMRSYFGVIYTDLEKEAQEKYGLTQEQSKPLIARHVAEKLPYDADGKGWQQLDIIARKIRELQAPNR